MKEYNGQTSDEFMAVCTVFMMVISPGTLSTLISHLYRKKTLVHWRLILAIAMMST
jgi:hypothetical protein